MYIEKAIYSIESTIVDENNSDSSPSDNRLQHIVEKNKENRVESKSGNETGKPAQHI